MNTASLLQIETHSIWNDNKDLYSGLSGYGTYSVDTALITIVRVV